MTTPEARRRRRVVEIAVLLALALSLIANLGAARSAQRNCERNQFVISFAHDSVERSLLSIVGDPKRGIKPNPAIKAFYDQHPQIRDKVVHDLTMDLGRLRLYDCPLFRF